MVMMMGLNRFFSPFSKSFKTQQNKKQAKPEGQNRHVGVLERLASPMQLRRHSGDATTVGYGVRG